VSTLREGQHFENRSPGKGLATAKAPGIFDVADDVDFAALGHADLFAAFQQDVGPGRRRRSGLSPGCARPARCVTGRRLGSGDQNLGTGLRGQRAGARDCFEQGVFAFSTG